MAESDEFVVARLQEAFTPALLGLLDGRADAAHLVGRAYADALAARAEAARLRAAKAVGAWYRDAVAAKRRRRAAALAARARLRAARNPAWSQVHAALAELQDSGAAGAITLRCWTELAAGGPRVVVADADDAPQLESLRLGARADHGADYADDADDDDDDDDEDADDGGAGDGAGAAGVVGGPRATLGATAAEAARRAALVHDVYWTKHARDWLARAEPKWARMCTDRVARVARGDWTYATAKVLRGSVRRKLLEAKLDHGMRVLWELRREESGGDAYAVLVWFVVAHDSISRAVRLINAADERVAAVDLRGAVLLDPLANTPLHCYRVAYDDLSRLAARGGWTPPLALTAEERRVVEDDGPTATLLLGRSGTGKTVCTAMRMVRDASRARGGAAPRHVFVARSPRLCAHVDRMLAAARDDGGRAAGETLSLEHFVERVAGLVSGEPRRWAARRRVTYAFFRDELWPVVRCGSRLEAHTVWTQVRSFIKGSAEAVVLGRGLGEAEFNVPAFNNRSRLDAAERSEALKICARYDGELRRRNLWDDADRSRCIAHAALQQGWRDGRAPYDHVYVDEVQDSTQAEVMLMFAACGSDPRRLWLAGDTAQAITYGVHFRFADVRSAIYHAQPSTAKGDAAKLQALTLNYRSHSGVLDVAAAVIDLLHARFAGAIDKLPRDAAVARGPKPQFVCAAHEAAMVALLRRDERFVVVTHDDLRDDVERTLASAGAARTLVLGVRAAKGLEFSHVVAHNLISASSVARRERPPVPSSWARLLQGDESCVLPRELETELMLLYTAVTRARTRLVLCETGEARAAHGVGRWLAQRGLAVTFAVEAGVDDTTVLLTPDEWRSRGIELLEGGLYEQAAAALERAGDAPLLAAARGEAVVAAARARLLGLAAGDAAGAERVLAEAAASALRCGAPRAALALCADAEGAPGREAALSVQQRFATGAEQRAARDELRDIVDLDNELGDLGGKSHKSQGQGQGGEQLGGKFAGGEQLGGKGAPPKPLEQVLDETTAGPAHELEARDARDDNADGARDEEGGATDGSWGHDGTPHQPDDTAAEGGATDGSRGRDGPLHRPDDTAAVGGATNGPRRRSGPPPRPDDDDEAADCAAAEAWLARRKRQAAALRLAGPCGTVESADGPQYAAGADDDAGPRRDSEAGATRALSGGFADLGFILEAAQHDLPGLFLYILTGRANVAAADFEGFLDRVVSFFGVATPIEASILGGYDPDTSLLMKQHGRYASCVRRFFQCHVDLGAADVATVHALSRDFVRCSGCARAFDGETGCASCNIRGRDELEIFARAAQPCARRATEAWLVDWRAAHHARDFCADTGAGLEAQLDAWAPMLFVGAEAQPLAHAVVAAVVTDAAHIWAALAKRGAPKRATCCRLECEFEGTPADVVRHSLLCRLDDAGMLARALVVCAQIIADAWASRYRRAGHDLVLLLQGDREDAGVAFAAAGYEPASDDEYDGCLTYIQLVRRELRSDKSDAGDGSGDVTRLDLAFTAMAIVATGTLHAYCDARVALYCLRALANAAESANRDVPSRRCGRAREQAKVDRLAAAAVASCLRRFENVMVRLEALRALAALLAYTQWSQDPDAAIDEALIDAIPFIGALIDATHDSLASEVARFGCLCVARLGRLPFLWEPLRRHCARPVACVLLRARSAAASRVVELLDLAAVAAVAWLAASRATGALLADLGVEEPIHKLWARADEPVQFESLSPLAADRAAYDRDYATLAAAAEIDLCPRAAARKFIARELYPALHRLGWYAILSPLAGCLSIYPPSCDRGMCGASDGRRAAGAPPAPPFRRDHDVLAYIRAHLAPPAALETQEVMRPPPSYDAPRSDLLFELALHELRPQRWCDVHCRIRALFRSPTHAPAFGRILKDFHAIVGDGGVHLALNSMPFRALIRATVLIFSTAKEMVEIIQVNGHVDTEELGADTAAAPLGIVVSDFATIIRCKAPSTSIVEWTSCAVRTASSVPCLSPFSDGASDPAHARPCGPRSARRSSRSPCRGRGRRWRRSSSSGRSRSSRSSRVRRPRRGGRAPPPLERARRRVPARGASVKVRPRRRAPQTRRSGPRSS
ncbi:hypothetical protein M885DRAFT_545628 [Pelagophyceae sp. CCMP2097]|nr:hypothetical protein M885DRAFT_545628 [Pelagophyceae sp. CCMP2097]